MIIDAHAHIYDILTGYGPRGEFRPLGGGRGVWANGEETQFFPAKYGDIGFKAEALIALMDEYGVDHAVLLQGGNYGFHNDYAAEAAAKYPTRFTPVCTLDPYCGFAESIMDNFIEKYKFKSIKFEMSTSWGLTGYHPEISLDNKFFAPILRRADECGMTVVLDLGPITNSSFQIDPIRSIVKTYKNLRIVMTHCFFPNARDNRNAERLGYMAELVSDRFYFDIANLPPMIPGNASTPVIRDFLLDAKKIVGADRLIWGTDLPGILNNHDYGQLRAYTVDSGVFTSSELEYVMAKNAIEIYRITGI